jgi:hypothetical protein
VKTFGANVLIVAAAALLAATPARTQTLTAHDGAAADVLAFERDIAAAIVRGDVAYMETALATDFVMVHGDGWTHGDAPALVDDRASFMKRVADKIYAAIDLDAQRAEVHGDVVITYGHYVGNIPSSPPGRRWFSVWYEKVYAKRDGRWVYLSHRTVDGAHYGDDRASVSLR